MNDSKRATQSSSKAVLVIDNEPLKREAIKQANLWLQKIKIIEVTTQKFNDVDLKLYSDWYNLSVQPLLADIEKVKDQVIRAANQFNELLLLARRKKISMPEALIFLEEEQQRYDTGDATTREKIENARAKRAKDLRRELNPDDDDEDNEPSTFDEANEQADQDKGFDESQNQFEDEQAAHLKKEADSIQKARVKFKKQIEYYENLSDDKITQVMKYFDDGVEFVVTAIKILTQTSHPELLRRIWKLTPAKIRKFLNKSATENTGMNLDDIIEDLGDRKKEREEFFEEKKTKKTEAKSTLNENHQLRLKSLYRKIVRRIHPDNFKSDSTPELKAWFDATWQKVMKAYQKEDVTGLQTQHNKIILVMNEHQELSIAEIYSAADSLKEEYEQLVEAYNDLKENPAWNFSSLKEYSKIQKKVFKPYQQQKKMLLDDLSDIRKQQSEIERIARLLQNSSIRITSAKSDKRRRKGRSRG